MRRARARGQGTPSLSGHTYNSHTSKVFAAGSEDMDTLTFNAPILFRHLTFSEAKKQPISEINLKVALAGLDMTMSQVRIIPPLYFLITDTFPVH